MDLFDSYEHSMDAKGRLVLPAALRSEFANGGVIANLVTCAALFPVANWERYRRRMEASRVFDRKELQYLLSFVSPFDLDSQHRVTLSNRLRSKLSLERELTSVGSTTHASVFSRAAWERLEAEVEGPRKGVASLADKIDQLEFV